MATQEMDTKQLVQSIKATLGDGCIECRDNRARELTLTVAAPAFSILSEKGLGQLHPATREEWLEAAKALEGVYSERF